MSKSPIYWNSAIKYLSKKDKVMKKLIYKYKDKTLTTRKDIFYSLCKSIIGQQISVAAADSVFKRFRLLCKNKINSKVVLKIKNSNLKKCGLSKQKVNGIKNLALQISNNTFNPKLIILFAVSGVIETLFSNDKFSLVEPTIIFEIF